MTMKRTQILLPDGLYRSLAQRARAEKTSLGALIRRALERSVPPPPDEAALAAYRNGLISLGKLAELCGLAPSQALEMLRERGLKPLFAPESREEARKDAIVAARSR